jgi:hypothetical protein
MMFSSIRSYYSRPTARGLMNTYLALHLEALIVTILLNPSSVSTGGSALRQVEASWSCRYDERLAAHQRSRLVEYLDRVENPSWSSVRGYPGQTYVQEMGEPCGRTCKQQDTRRKP